MKLSNLFFVLMMSIPAIAVAAPCDGNLEARFVAQYKDVQYSYAEAGNLEHMFFGFQDFSFYQVNELCPLSLERAQKAVIERMEIDTNVKDGGLVSGVLVYNPKFDLFGIK